MALKTDQREVMKWSNGPTQATRSQAGGCGTSSFPARVVSREPPLRWEDAMLSGNGSTGIMVMGLPLDDTIIVNHEKLWAIANNFEPHVPDMRKAWDDARRIAQTGRYRDADTHIVEAARDAWREMYDNKTDGRRPGYDRTHPGFHLHVSTASNGRPQRYRRETDLETGEILDRQPRRLEAAGFRFPSA